MSGARLTSVVLLVRDVSRALRLYRDGLGLPLAASTVTLARFALGGGASLDVRVAANEAQCSTGYAPLLSFTVADMDAVVPRLLSHGAALDGAVRYNDYGRTAAVRTPDGHMLGLYEPTGLPEGGDNALAAAAAARARLKQGVLFIDDNLAGVFAKEAAGDETVVKTGGTPSCQVEALQ